MAGGRLIDLIGLAGAALTTLCWLPQMVKAIRERDTRAQSLWRTGVRPRPVTKLTAESPLKAYGWWPPHRSDRARRRGADHAVLAAANGEGNPRAGHARAIVVEDGSSPAPCHKTHSRIAAKGVWLVAASSI